MWMARLCGILTQRAALSGQRLLLPDTAPVNLILPVIAASSVAKQHPKLP